MAEHKVQHFLPQFYFRLFSRDGRTIWSYAIKNKKAFPTSFTTLGAGKYFYSTNPEIEKSFIPLEGMQAKVLKSIIENKSLLHLGVADYTTLLWFILFQRARTKTKKLDMKATTKKIFDEWKEDMGNTKEAKEFGITQKDLDSVEFVWHGEHLSAILNHLQNAPLIGDLNAVLLINKTSTEFIFGDSPVIFYNRFFYGNKEHSTLGIASVGLQIFCPISPNLTVFLFDSNCYEVLNQKNNACEITKKEDINALNKLQVFECGDNIFFTDKKKVEYVKRIGQLSKKRDKQVKVDTFFTPLSDTTFGKVIRLGNPKIPYELNLSFVKIKDYNPTDTVRDRKEYEIQKKLNQQAKKQLD